MSTPYKVAVIGAGVSGLTTAKCLIDEGIQPIVFEKSDTIGGLWNFDDTSQNGGGPAYQSLRTNTSKRTMSFSDFPFPIEAKDYPFWTDVLDYLHYYVDYFHLKEHILLNTTVLSAKPLGRNKWEVKYNNESEYSLGIFDTVVVCTGKHQNYEIPESPGLSEFQGQVYHSLQYKDPTPFTGKNILVVGAGASSVDIATELTGLAQKVVLSIRNGVWITPRYIGNYPADHQISRISTITPNWFRTFIFKHLILKEYRKLGINGGLNHFGVPETNFDLNSVRLTLSSDLLSALKNKEITIKPGIKKFLKNKVIFTDDSEQSVDTVIFATGYTFKFPFLTSDIIDTNANDLDLYKYIFHPKLPNLAFIGMCIVQGPFPPVFEMQARWAARVLSGKLHLPSQDYMYADIRKKRVHLQKIGGRPMMVMLIEYMDELANEIGVKPRLLKHIRYIYKILFGPFSPSQYRLDGPGSWDKAIQAIKDIS